MDNQEDQNQNQINNPSNKRPVSAFVLFSRVRRPILKSEFPQKSGKEIFQLIVQEWKALPMDEKEIYINRRTHLLEEYQNQHNKPVSFKKIKKKRAIVFSNMNNIDLTSLHLSFPTIQDLFQPSQNLEGKKQKTHVHPKNFVPSLCQPIFNS